ncbi:hypothetical protein Tco_0793552 [Tanacetum coccineum]
MKYEQKNSHGNMSYADSEYQKQFALKNDKPYKKIYSGALLQGWTNDLARVLWVHRTLPRNSQNETPFTLTYDLEDIIPLAVSLIPEGKEHAIKEKAKREACEER